MLYQQFEQSDTLNTYVNQTGLSQYLFTWINQFISTHQKSLQQNDVFNIKLHETIQYQRLNFKLIDKNLILSLLKGYPLQFLGMLFLKASLMGILLLNPIIINNIVELFDSDIFSMLHFTYTIGILVAWISAIYAQMSILTFYQKQINTQVQAALSSLLFKKLFTAPLPLPSQAEIINFFQIDIPQITILFDCGVSLFLTPFQIGGAIFIYFKTVGVAASFGIIGMVIQVAISLIYGSIYSKLQNKIMKSRDKRVSNIDELLRGILTIKQNCYYKFFFNRIRDKRQNEMDDIALQQKSYFFVQTLFAVVPVGVMYFSMQVFDIFNLKSILMVTQNYTQLIQSVNFIPYNLGQILMARISLNRLMAFLSQNDTEYQQLNQSKPQIIINDGYYRWRNDQDKFQLQSLNITIKEGQFVVIVGNNGSGKSSLLYTIMGELECTNPNTYFSIEGSISIATQEPFLNSSSIFENILDGSTFNKERYLRVLKITQLLDDITIMPSGHNTEAGENGQSLSGGQRKRVHLARTLYRKSDIYLLDCPFAALDGRTASKMYEELQQFQQQYGCTIVITCNEANLIKKCNRIIQLQNGKIIYNGELQNFNQQKYKSTSLDDVVEQDNQIQQFNKFDQNQLYNLIDKNANQVMEQEDRAIGNLQIDLFKQLYSLYGKSPTLFFVLLFCILGMCSSSIYQLQLKSITEISDSPKSTEQEKMDAAAKFLLIYPVSQILIALFQLINGLYLTSKGVTASVKLHNNIVNNLLKASVAEFYNVTLASVVKNRLTSDIFQFDTNTPTLVSSLFANTFEVFALIFACLYLSAALSYPILICYLILQSYYTLKYININLEISRVQAISKTPILNYLSETQSGILFKRHCKSYTIQEKNYDQMINSYSKNCLCSAAVYSWFIQITCLLMVIMYVAVIFVNYIYKLNNKESATISMYLAIRLGEQFANFILKFQAFYSNNVYLERCLALVNSIPKEDLSSQQYSDFENPLDRRRNNSAVFSDNDNFSSLEMMTINSVESVQEFKDQFIIELNDISLQYQFTTVLQNVTLKLKKGEKVAIIGRTGAGKTSLMHCITRLVEPLSGQLKVQGQDNRNTTINRIRQLFSVVSQDPFVFEGTVKQNIDPNNALDISEISRTLAKFGLSQIKLLNNPEFLIEQNGQNLSLGEKQLLVICRVLLQKRKIVILDECTGNLDEEYSKLINVTLDLFMKDKTVIAITHKLDLLDMFDHVVIIDQGKIVKDGQKSEVLEKIQNELD